MASDPRCPICRSEPSSVTALYMIDGWDTLSQEELQIAQQLIAREPVKAPESPQRKRFSCDEIVYVANELLGEINKIAQYRTHGIEWVRSPFWDSIRVSMDPWCAFLSFCSNYSEETRKALCLLSASVILNEPAPLHLCNSEMRKIFFDSGLSSITFGLDNEASIYLRTQFGI